MRQKINEKVTVVSYYSAKKNTYLPHLISWHNKEFKVGEIGLHSKYKDGDVWYHIFELADKDQSMFFRLNFNTKDLDWTLEVVADGLPS